MEGGEVDREHSWGHDRLQGSVYHTFTEKKVDDLSKETFTAFNLVNHLNTPQGYFIYNLSKKISEKRNP